NNQVSGVSGELPEDANEPEVQSVTNSFPLLSYQITAEDGDSLDDIRSDLEDLEREVTQMEGIDSVTIKGYNDHQYEVQLDYDSMVENQLDPNSIRSEIESSLNPVILGQET